MKSTPYLNVYRQNSVQTASPGQLILMLFDGALRMMNMALKGFEEPDVLRRNETVHFNLIKTQAIIDELKNSLNHAQGGDFARNMADPYDFMRGQLRQANVKKDPSPVKVVVGLVGEIRGAWSAMLAQVEGQAPVPASWSATAA